MPLYTGIVVRQRSQISLLRCFASRWRRQRSRPNRPTELQHDPYHLGSDRVQRHAHDDFVKLVPDVWRTRRRTPASRCESHRDSKVAALPGGDFVTPTIGAVRGRSPFNRPFAIRRASARTASRLRPIGGHDHFREVRSVVPGVDLLRPHGRGRARRRRFERRGAGPPGIPGSARLQPCVGRRGLKSCATGDVGRRRTEVLRYWRCRGAPD